MVDEVDKQQVIDELFDELKIKAIRDEAAKMSIGNQGDCDLCGHWSGRLVNGVCAPCRDRYEMP